MNAVPVAPWIASAGRSALAHGVYVYDADVFGLTLGASNGSLDGRALRRYWMRVPRESLETCSFDLADHVAREIRRTVNAGYVMKPDPALDTWLSERAS